MYYQQLLKKELGIIISLIIVLCFVGQSFAFTEPPYIPVTKPTPTATKTVCASGCDYSTLSAANSAAQPGWLIKVKAGTYSPITWTKSGTSGNEIVIEAFGDGDAIINCTGTSRFSVAGSYIIFDGGPNRQLVFNGEGLTGPTALDTFRTDGYYSPHHVTISRIVVHGSMKNSCAGDGTNIGIGGDNIKVYNSVSYEACDEGFYIEGSPNGGVNIEIKNNLVRDNDGSGIQANPHNNGTYAADNLSISGNAVYNNGFRKWHYNNDYRSGITLYSNSDTLRNTYIYNNLIWNNKAAGIEVGPYSNINVRVYNNTVYNNIGYGLLYTYTQPTITTKNNISYANRGSDTTRGTMANNLIAVVGGPDPGFVSIDVNNSDYLKITSSSTNTVDKGADLTSEGIKTDILGNRRPINLFDIGAFEYNPGVPLNEAPAVPQAVRKVLQ